MNIKKLTSGILACTFAVTSVAATTAYADSMKDTTPLVTAVTQSLAVSASLSRSVAEDSIVPDSGSWKNTSASNAAKVEIAPYGSTVISALAGKTEFYVTFEVTGVPEGGCEAYLPTVITGGDQHWNPDDTVPRVSIPEDGTYTVYYKGNVIPDAAKFTYMGINLKKTGTTTDQTVTSIELLNVSLTAPSNDLVYEIGAENPSDVIATLDEEGNLVISGTGAMKDFGYWDNGPWSEETVKTVVVEEGVTSIGQYAFRDMEEIESITLAESVSAIGRGAFVSSGTEDCVMEVKGDIDSYYTGAIDEFHGKINLEKQSAYEYFYYNALSYQNTDENNIVYTGSSEDLTGSVFTTYNFNTDSTELHEGAESVSAGYALDINIPEGGSNEPLNILSDMTKEKIAAYSEDLKVVSFDVTVEGTIDTPFRVYMNMKTDYEYNKSWSVSHNGSPAGNYFSGTNTHVISEKISEPGTYTVTQYISPGLSSATLLDNYIYLLAIDTYTFNDDVKISLDSITFSNTYMDTDDVTVEKAPLNYDALDAAIEAAEAVDTTLYTSGSVAVLTTALESAKNVRNDADVAQADVDKAAAELNDAIEALIEKGDMTALEQAIADAKAIDTTKYTDDTVAALTDAIADAEAVAANEDATQTEIDDAADALSEAVAGLVEKPADNSSVPDDNESSIPDDNESSVPDTSSVTDTSSNTDTSGTSSSTSSATTSSKTSTTSTTTKTTTTTTTTTSTTSNPDTGAGATAAAVATLALGALVAAKKKK